MHARPCENKPSCAAESEGESRTIRGSVAACMTWLHAWRRGVAHNLCTIHAVTITFAYPSSLSARCTDTTNHSPLAARTDLMAHLRSLHVCAVQRGGANQWPPLAQRASGRRSGRTTGLAKHQADSPHDPLAHNLQGEKAGQAVTFAMPFANATKRLRATSMRVRPLSRHSSPRFDHQSPTRYGESLRARCSAAAPGAGARPCWPC